MPFADAPQASCTFSSPAARAAGLDGVHEAQDPSAQGIVDALIDALGAGPDHAP